MRFEGRLLADATVLLEHFSKTEKIDDIDAEIENVFKALGLSDNVEKRQAYKLIALRAILQDFINNRERGGRVMSVSVSAAYVIVIDVEARPPHTVQGDNKAICDALARDIAKLGELSGQLMSTYGACIAASAPGGPPGGIPGQDDTESLPSGGLTSACAAIWDAYTEVINSLSNKAIAAAALNCGT